MESNILDLTLAATHRHSSSPLSDYQSPQTNDKDVEEETLDLMCRSKIKKTQIETCDDVITFGSSSAGFAKDENTCPVDLSLSTALNSPVNQTSNSSDTKLGTDNELILGKASRKHKLEEPKIQDSTGYLGDYPSDNCGQNFPTCEADKKSSIVDGDANMPTSSAYSGSSSSSSPPSLCSGAASAATLLPSLIDRFLLAAAAVQGKSTAAGTLQKKFKCQKCQAAFKCKETLDGHNQSYCPMRKPSITPVTSSLATSGALNRSGASLLSGSGNGVNNKNHVRELSSLVAQQTSSSEELLEKVHQQLSNLENAVMASNGFDTQHRLGMIPSGLVGNVRKHQCSACGVMFSRLDTLKIHKEKYCAHKTASNDDNNLNVGNSDQSLLGNNARNVAPKDSYGDKKVLTGTVPVTTPVTATGSAPLPALAGLLECAVAAAASASVSNTLRPASPQTLQRVLASRKRRSPNTENDQDFKPYAKFQCRSCHVKFIHETTLKAHEQSYCTVRQTVANYESQSPPLQTSRNSTKAETSGVDCGGSNKSQSSSPESSTFEDSPTNKKLACISTPSNCSGAPLNPQQQQRSNNISSVCKMCDAFLLEGTLNQHLKIYHRISNPQTLSAILDTSSAFSEHPSNSALSSSCKCSKGSLQTQRQRILSKDSSNYESSTGNGHENQLGNGNKMATGNDELSISNGIKIDRKSNSPHYLDNTTAAEEYTLEKENMD